MMLKLLVTMALISAASVAGKSDDATTCSASADLSCDAGFSLEGSTCTACVPATASVCGNGKTARTATQVCPAGTAVAYTASTAASGSDCVDCAAGKFAAADSANGCTDCRDDAETCTSLTEDSTCNIGFFLDGNACTACGNANTAACSSNSVSTECNAGYFVASNACTACDTNTATCSDPTTALTCNEGYSPQSNTCTLCVPASASTCGNGKAPVTAAQACLAGRSTSYTASIAASGSDCVTCAAGKFAAADNANGCTDCRENAETCSSSTVDTACSAGYFVDSDVCTACAANTAACTSATVATTCNAGFYKSSANECTNCDVSAGSALQISALLSAATLLVALCQ